MFLDMIDEQYKKDQERAWKGKKGFGKGQKRVGNRARTALEQDQERVLKGTKIGFKRYKNEISPNSRICKGEEWPHSLFLHFSSRFFSVPPLFSPVFHDLGQKQEKKCQQMEERERKEKFSFLFFSRSRFLPFLSKHISSWKG